MWVGGFMPQVVELEPAVYLLPGTRAELCSHFVSVYINANKKSVCCSAEPSFPFFSLQAAWGIYASMVATCRWTASHEMGFPRSAYKACLLGAHLTPAKGTNVAPLLPALTCGECTNAGTRTNPRIPNAIAQSSTHALPCEWKAWKHLRLNPFAPFETTSQPLTWILFLFIGI